MNKNIDFIPFHKAYVGKEEEEAVVEVLRSGWLTTGSKVAQFESEFATSVGAKHAIAVSSATAGLFLSLKALNLPETYDVITTPYTFISTAEIVEWSKMWPYFVDVEEDTYNININNLSVLKEVEEYFPAIIPVHIAGVKCDMEGIYKAMPKSLVIEDCAHFFPSKFNSRSTTAVYSFYATKSITTGEGGMVITNNDYIAKKIRILSNHGISQTTYDRYTSTKNKWYYEVNELGYKYNMAEIPAALGIVQLKKAEEMLLKRKSIAEKYNEAFNKFDFLKTPVNRPDNTWHLYIMRIVIENLTINRDTFIEKLTNAGIGVSVHFIPLHMMPYYQSKRLSFPVAEKLFYSSISLPIFPSMTNEQIEYVIEIIKTIGEGWHK